MRVSNVEVDTYGRLALGGIHDAIVKELHLVEGCFFTIRLLGINGEDRIIRLSDIGRIGFQDVVNGTIISDILCLKLNSPNVLAGEPRAAWRTLLGDAYTEHGLQHAISDLVARHADSFLVVFESAYGGSISAICSEIECT
jgi:hypothetical protein